MRHETNPLEVCRSVSGITDEHIDTILERISNYSEQVGLENESLVKLFSYPSRLKATIISYGELKRLHTRIGRSITVGGMEDLAEYIREGSPLSSTDTLVVPTLPAQLHTAGRKKTAAKLSLGTSSTVMTERVFAQNAVRNFYNLDSVPEGVWMDDEFITEVNFARAHNKAGAQVLRRLLDPTSEMLTILPQSLRFSPLTINFAE